MDDHSLERDPFEVVADSFLARYRAGERPGIDEYATRHPDLADQIRELFPALVMVERDLSLDQGLESPGAHRVSGGAPERLGDYQILREVGRGGMGIVYEAVQQSLGRHVALKVLPWTNLGSGSNLKRFHLEARAAARLHHTNIVPVFAVGEHDGNHYFAMQFIRGQGLDQIIDEVRRLRGSKDRSALPDLTALCRPDGPPIADKPARRPDDSDSGAGEPAIESDRENRELGSTPTIADASAPAPVDSPSEGRPAAVSVISSRSGLTAPERLYFEGVARIGLQIAEALDYAHAQGILHRDIKPSNLMMDAQGTVWVTDFGLAKSAGSHGPTRTGDVVGTLRYMPPEAFDGRSDPRGDLYGLGATLYELLTLEPVFDDRHRPRLIDSVLRHDPVPPRTLDPRVPRDLEVICLKCLNKEPARRYASAGELAQELRRYLAGEPIRARRSSPLERAWRWGRRNRAFAGLVSALAGVLVLATVGSVVAAGRLAALAEAKGNAAIRERGAKLLAQQLQKQAEVDRGIALDAQAKALEALDEADRQRGLVRENLYYAQMHLAQQGWREHRGLRRMHELLANWRPGAGADDLRGWEWHYLSALPSRNLQTLPKPPVATGACNVAWRPDGRALAEGSTDGVIRIWDTHRDRPTLTLSGPGRAGAWWNVHWFRWRADGKVIAAGYDDATVRLWDADAGREISVLRGHKRPVASVAFSPDGKRLASWEFNGSIKIWNIETALTEKEMPGASGVTSGAFSGDGKRLATGRTDGSIAISDAATLETMVTIAGHADLVYDLDWSPDGSRLASSGGDFTAKIWNPATGELIVGPLRHSHGILAAAWAPDGTRLATGGIDNSVKVWDAATGREELVLRGHYDAVASLAWNPDGHSLASGSADGSVRIWNPIRDQEAKQLPGHARRATAVAWSPAGDRLASAGDDGKIRIWDYAENKELTPFENDEGPIWPQFGLTRALAWRPDGRRLAAGDLNGVVKVWDVDRSTLVHSFRLPNNRIWAAAWRPDGEALYLGCADGTIRVIESPGGSAAVTSIPAHQGAVRSLAWSPSGDRLASGGFDATLKVWDPSLRAAPIVWKADRSVWAAAWRPDGKRLAASCGNVIIEWDALSGRRLAVMHGHNDWPEAIAWSPEGTRLASAGLDNSVRLWDPDTGEETLVLRGDAGMFRSVSWKADGKALAAAGNDGRIWIWDASTPSASDAPAIDPPNTR